ncbi:SET domain-containing protein [Tabrizicola piscis]|nr:SET domain-containing protein-lysine N-methyltransferase [Tabrizicola piscis]
MNATVAQPVHFGLQSVPCARAINNRNVAVRLADNVKGRGVFAIRDHLPGEVVLIGLIESLADRRTNHSIQLDWNVHANFEEPASLINHSCLPNTFVSPNRFGAYDFIALRAIASGEELSFDYATTEYESIAVPNCACGSPACRGSSGGFSVLDSTHELTAYGFIAPYLLRGTPTSNLVLQGDFDITPTGVPWPPQANIAARWIAFQQQTGSTASNGQI